MSIWNGFWFCWRWRTFRENSAAFGPRQFFVFDVVLSEVYLSSNLFPKTKIIAMLSSIMVQLLLHFITIILELRYVLLDMNGWTYDIFAEILTLHRWIDHSIRMWLRLITWLLQVTSIWYKMFCILIIIIDSFSDYASDANFDTAHTLPTTV